jgi:membrane complex biogenesis BtpA family protein
MTRSILQRTFGRSRGVIIGSLHFPPLPPYPDAPSLEASLRMAMADLRAFERGGVHAVIFENNYDLPHTVEVTGATAAAMAYLGTKLRAATRLPLGVNVLWNDYRASLTLAVTLGLQFVRIPVLVDTVRTSYGVVRGDAASVAAFRCKLGAGNLAVFADIHVKHAELLSKSSIVQSAKAALRGGADGVIVTGRWTGNAPDLQDLAAVRRAVGDALVLVGSGTDTSNVGKLLRLANGTIISTSLKRGAPRRGQVNVKAYRQRIEVAKVRALVRAARVR